MKTFVVLAGLIALVPQVDQQGNVQITALILRADGQVLGHPVHPHEPLIRFFGGGGQVFQNSKAATLTAGSGSITIVDPNRRILGLNTLYPRGLPLKNDCLSGGEPQTSCRRPDGSPALVGRVTFKGAWTLRPVEIDYLQSPRPNDIDTTVLGFVSYQQPHVSTVEVSVAGAILFETDQPLSAQVDGQSVSPPAIPSCAVFNLDPVQCSFIRVSNLPKTGGPAGPKCGERQGEVDEHFDLIYGIFDSSSTAQPLTFRYLPFNRTEDVVTCQRILHPPGPGDAPPRIKCPSTLLAPILMP